MTSRTAARRAGRSAGPGSSNRMFAADRVRLARTTRWAMVGAGTRKGAGDVLGVEAADQLQREGRARIRRQDRVGGHEDQAEEVVREVALDELVEVVLYNLRAGSDRQAQLAAVGVSPSDP